MLSFVLFFGLETTCFVGGSFSSPRSSRTPEDVHSFPCTAVHTFNEQALSLLPSDFRCTSQTESQPYPGGCSGGHVPTSLPRSSPTPTCSAAVSKPQTVTSSAPLAVFLALGEAERPPRTSTNLAIYFACHGDTEGARPPRAYPVLNGMEVCVKLSRRCFFTGHQR